MGLFGFGKSQEDRQQQAEDIVAGKGLTGKLTKAFMGQGFMDQMQGAMNQLKGMEHAQQLVQQGAQTVRATLTHLADTGQTINDNPRIAMTLTLENGAPMQLNTLVSRLQIPRVGDTVTLVLDSTTNQYLYAGIAV